VAPKYRVTTSEYESTDWNYDIYTSDVTQKTVFWDTYTMSLRWMCHRSDRQPKTYVKPEAAITVFWAPDDGRRVARNMSSN